MNLQPFDYEEAKKDPERVRFYDESVPVWVDFVRDVVVVQWIDYLNAYDKAGQSRLRLTPKPPETVKVWFVRSGPNDAWRVCAYKPVGWETRGPVEVTVPEE